MGLICSSQLTVERYPTLAAPMFPILNFAPSQGIVTKITKVGDSGAAFDKACPYEHQVPISEAELQRAIGILEQFNLVNITEFLNDKVDVDYLAATLHLPLATKKLSRTRGNEPLAIAPEGTV